MEIRPFADIPIGALVRAHRRYRRTEAKTLWAIKARQSSQGGQERISLFWLEPLDDHHPPGFDLQCPDSMLFVSPSLKIVADMETSQFHPTPGDLFGNFWGLVIAKEPWFLGEAFNQAGDALGKVTCTLEGECLRAEEMMVLIPTCVTIPDWRLEPSDEPMLVPRRGLCNLLVTDGPLTK